jgi:K+ transporter
MQQPNVPAILALCAPRVTVTAPHATYYLGRQTAHHRQVERRAMAQDAVLVPARNARPPTAFQLPPNRVVELGLQIEL